MVARRDVRDRVGRSGVGGLTPDPIGDPHHRLGRSTAFGSSGMAAFPCLTSCLAERENR